MDCQTAGQMAKSFRDIAEGTLLCPYCFWILAENDEGVLYCPNEMCLNEDVYDKNGIWFLSRE